jgi:hypothetical protein
MCFSHWFFLSPTSQKPQQIRVSSPSTHQDRVNRHKTKEKKLSRNWHSSYVPSRIIKAVENKQTRPTAGPSHLTHHQPP